jgi:hypothetical protein
MNLFYFVRVFASHKILWLAKWWELASSHHLFFKTFCSQLYGYDVS